jgi:hypothetical protein
MFKVVATDGLARAGVLATSSSTMTTPGMLIYARRGMPLNLTPDMLDTLKPLASAVQINALHL